MFAGNELVEPRLIGTSKTIERLPTQRRRAIQFRYGGLPSDYEIQNLGVFSAPSPANACISGHRGDIVNVPCQEVEIRLCVGFAVETIIRPNWDQVRQLGRALAILKVHLPPHETCELWFMPREEVERSYKETLPKNVEWVNMYDPTTEFAFWAELLRPSAKAGRGTSLLTGTVCGGFGSRYTLVRHLQKNIEAVLSGDPDVPQRAKEMCRGVLGHTTRAEYEALTQSAQRKAEKNKKKKAKQREKKAQQREQDSQDRAEFAALEAAAARAQRMPAPHLQGLDFARMMQGSAADDGEACDGEPSSDDD